VPLALNALNTVFVVFSKCIWFDAVSAPVSLTDFNSLFFIVTENRLLSPAVQKRNRPALWLCAGRRYLYRLSE
jgi:hypothetical protein